MIAMTVGFGAAITGLFGLGEGVMTGRQSAFEQRCSVAQQIVIDESPNLALSEQQKRRTAALAMQALELCLGEEA